MPDSTQPPVAPVTLHKVHEIEHRARLRTADPADRETLIDLANRLAPVAGVERVLARPATGSLVVETRASAGAVLAAMEAEGLVAFAEPPRKPPVRQTVQLGFAKTDYDLEKQTGGALDLRTALGLFLLGAAIVQLSRGQIAGPATTLAASALGLLELSGKG